MTYWPFLWLHPQKGENCIVLVLTHSHAIILFHPLSFSLAAFTVEFILAAYLLVIDDTSMVPILRGHVLSTCCPFEVDFRRITAFSIR